MKKKMTKKGWLLGALVALIVLVGVSPAMAGYIFVGNFYDVYDDPNNMDGFSDFTRTGINKKKTWSSHLPVQTLPLYQFTQKNKFYVDGVKQGDETTDHKGSDGWSVWDGAYEYIIIKQGNDNSNPQSGDLVDLYKYSATGTELQNLDKYGNSAGGYKISHISGYNSVPIPGAIWLLSSGLFGLVCIRRRKKS